MKIKSFNNKKKKNYLPNILLKNKNKNKILRILKNF